MPESVELFYRDKGNGEALIILHGLYGSSDNWQSVARLLTPRFRVISIDLRNHGKSPHHPSHTYPDMANDIVQLLDKLVIKQACLLGHSMGGKVAMQLAITYPERVSSLIVADISPVSYKSLFSHSPQSVEHLNILHALGLLNPSTLLSRDDADQQLAQWITNDQVRQFLLKNLVRTGTHFKWQLNIDALTKQLPQILDAITTDNETKPFEKPSLFIRGEKSNYILDEHEPEIKKWFPMSELVTLFDAGHWLHAEQPEAFFNVLTHFFDTHSAI